MSKLKSCFRGEWKWIHLAVALFSASFSGNGVAIASGLEASMGFSFNRSKYSDTDYNWVRRWGASLGYEFTDRSEIEFAFQDITDRTQIVGYEDTTVHDQIYSVNWVQSILGREAPVQPYFKLGIGQLNREATGSYANGAAPPRRVDSITGILAGGIRIYLTRKFAIRAEVISYLVKGNITTWQDNMGVTLGVSLHF